MPKGDLTGDYTCDGAIAEVWYEFREFSRANNPVNAAHHLIELSNRIGDLASWHVDYNENTGDIDGVFEDD